MPWTDFIGPAVTAAVVSGAVTVGGFFVTLRTARERAAVDEKLAELKGEIDRDLAKRRASVDERLSEIKGALDKELAEQKARLDNKVLYAAEDVAYALMRHSKWRLRSWNVIKVHLGGFADDELRKILVRAGAIRFEAKSGSELWGLLDRNRDLLGVTQVPWDPENPSHRPTPSWMPE
jgi:hypothetical protein